MKVTIVGCGNVGAALSHALLLSEYANEILLINRTHERAVGEAADLQDAVAFANKPMKVRAGQTEDAAGSDIVVLTLSDKPDHPVSSRNEFASINLPVMRKWIPPLAKVCPDAIFVIVTNPVDVMTYVAWKISGLPANQFIGTGTLIDSARWRMLLSNDLHIHPDDIRAYILGEHGETQFPALSVAVTGGQKIDDDQRHEELFQQARMAAYEIYKRKGHTSFGIAGSTMLIIGSILRDLNRTLPVSVVLNDYHGVNNVCLSVPVIVGRTGVVQLLDPDLSSAEGDKFRASAEQVSRVIESLGPL